RALSRSGPQLIEVDMTAIGDFAERFAGPAGGRGGKRVTSIRSKLAQPLRRGELEDLRGLVIDEPLELEGASLPNVDFSGSTFNTSLVLRGAAFGGLAWFTG